MKEKAAYLAGLAALWSRCSEKPFPNNPHRCGDKESIKALRVPMTRSVVDEVR